MAATEGGRLCGSEECGLDDRESADSAAEADECLPIPVEDGGCFGEMGDVGELYCKQQQ